MKELKFRAWDGKEIIDDVVPASETSIIEFNDGYEWQEIEVEAVEQYTGIKDKNGKDIYEGDIVDVIFPTKLRGVEEHQILVCRFGVKRAGFVLNRETNARIFSLTFGEINAKNLAVEVIGNIHENADLLEEE